MNKLTCVTLSILFTGLLAHPSPADGLQKSRVPAGARWLVHLDVEALKSSRLYKTIRDQSATKDGANEIDAAIAQIQATAGLDPLADFKSATLYCTTKAPEKCVALLSGNEKIDDAVARLTTMANYRTEKVGARSMHVWGDDHETWYAFVYRKDGAAERVVAVSQSTEELSRGIAVLEGGGDNLSGVRQAALQASPSSGSILFASAGEALNELGEIEPVSAVAKLARRVVFDLGEDRGALYAHVDLDARTPQDAQRIQQVIQGAVALAALAGDDEHAAAHAKLRDLSDALRVTLSDNRVNVDFRYDVKGLFDDLKALGELHEKADGDKPHKKHHEKKHPPKSDDDDK
jgi:hypothetical protein